MDTVPSKEPGKTPEEPRQSPIPNNEAEAGSKNVEGLSPESEQLVATLGPNKSAETAERLRQSKAAHKAAEESRRMIANRIQLLKAATEKATKKILATKEKAKELLKIKDRNSTAQKLREDQRRRKQELEAELTTEARARRNQLKQSIAAQQQLILSQRTQTTLAIKEELTVNLAHMCRRPSSWLTVKEPTRCRLSPRRASKLRPRKKP